MTREASQGPRWTFQLQVLAAVTNVEVTRCGRVLSLHDVVNAKVILYAPIRA